MDVRIAQAAEIVLRNSTEDDRRQVGAWIDNLKRWKEDPYLQQHAKKLDSDENVYALVTSTDIWIFFEVAENTITILDLARKAAIVGSRRMTGASKS